MGAEELSRLASRLGGISPEAVGADAHLTSVETRVNKRTVKAIKLPNVGVWISKHGLLTGVDWVLSQ